ncbi:MAG TPA: hypothetical protein VEH50_09680 [Methylomirabilota bacterium]|nr:hypothetical protein [Methylomirabilota bacterium]
MQWAWMPVMFAVAVILGGPQTATAPTKMTHLIAQMSGTDIPPDSFASKPKVFWRASNQYCRVDEEPDPANGIHGRMIINEPDAWLVNLADNTAKHMVDPGPTFNCRLPIFANDPETLKTKIGELEFGRELEFFQANGAELVEGPKLEFKADYYELRIGDSVLRLVERSDVHVPIMISRVRGDNVTVVRYSLWDDQVPFEADFFAKPTGVTTEEVH